MGSIVVSFVAGRESCRGIQSLGSAGN